MVYPINAIDKLGFSEIKDKIKQKCLSESGRELVEKIQPQTRFDQIDRFLRQTSEFKDLLMNDGAFPVENFFPLRSIIEKARVEGAFLLEDEFFGYYYPSRLFTLLSVILMSGKVSIPI